MRILLSSLLLIGLVGRGQTNLSITYCDTIGHILKTTHHAIRQEHKGDIIDINSALWEVVNVVNYSKKQINIYVAPLNGHTDLIPRHYLLPEVIEPPRTAAWASLQNEVNELKKEVETLKIFEKHDWNQIEMEVVVREFLEAQVDSLIKALRERDKPDTSDDSNDGDIEKARRVNTTHPANAFLGYTVGDSVYQDLQSAMDAADRHPYRTNTADPAAAKVIHFNNGCDLGTVRHGKGWARKHKVKK